MGLYKRKDSPYFWYKFTIEGRHYQDSTRTENRKLAERIMAKDRDAIIEGRHFKVTNQKKATTFQDFTIGDDPEKKRYGIYIEDYARVHKASWKSDDLNCCKSFCRSFGATELASLTTEDLNKYFRERSKNVAKSTVNHEITILRCILNYAVDNGYLHGNPALKVKRYKKVDNRRKRVLRKEELERFMAAADSDMRLITLFALNSFLRKKDLKSVTAAHVDREGRYINTSQSKTQKDISIPINDTLLYVVSHLDIPISWDFRSRFEKARKKAGIEDFQFRDLRRTGATYLHGLGVDLYTIAVLLGHKAPDALTMIKENLQMTARYTQVSNDVLYNAVKRLDGYCGISSGMKWTGSATNLLRSENDKEFDPTNIDITPLESIL